MTMHHGIYYCDTCDFTLSSPHDGAPESQHEAWAAECDAHEAECGVCPDCGGTLQRRRGPELVACGCGTEDE